jgi:hypothetical protein
MTGAVTTFKVKALTRAVVYEIAKDDIAPVLKERPAIAAELSQIMMRREAAGKALLGTFDRTDEHPPNLRTQITDRLKVLFGLAPSSRNHRCRSPFVGRIRLVITIDSDFQVGAVQKKETPESLATASTTRP